MKESLSDLEKHMNEEDGMDHLIRAALIHYQFETIHSFLDGNGRIGRLLIVLYLLEQNVIHTPSLYISLYLKENRVEYYDRMTAVRETGDYEQWVKFFIRAILRSGHSAVETAEKLIKLQEKNLELIKSQGYTTRALKTVENLFRYVQNYPIIDIQKTSEALNLSYNTVASAVRRLEGVGILKRLNEKERNKLFVYVDYLDILREGTEV